jgi:hypothetical protein
MDGYKECTTRPPNSVAEELTTVARSHQLTWSLLKQYVSRMCNVDHATSEHPLLYDFAILCLPFSPSLLCIFTVGSSIIPYI